MQDTLTEYTIFEGMTSISALIETITNHQSDRQILDLYFDKDRLYKKHRELAFLKAKSHELNFPIHLVASSDLDALATGNTHGGVIARTTNRTYLPLTEADLSEKGFWVLLDGIEDPYNFGYTIRSLYAAGVDGIVLPERNWLSASGTVARSSAGTSEKIPIRICDPERALPLFRECGYRIYAAEIKNATSLFTTDLKKPLVFVIGGEKRGISASVLGLCDANVRIEYGREFRGSLSAAATSAIIAFEVLRQNPASID